MLFDESKMNTMSTGSSDSHGQYPKKKLLQSSVGESEGGGITLVGRLEGLGVLMGAWEGVLTTGWLVGSLTGLRVGESVGWVVGLKLGELVVGSRVGESVGWLVGLSEGASVG